MCWAISVLPNQGGRQCEAEIRSSPRHLQISPFVPHFSSINLTFGLDWLCCFVDACSHSAIVLSRSIMRTISHRDMAPSWWENQSEFIHQSGPRCPLTDWVAFCTDGAQVRCQVWDLGLVLFGTAGATQMRCTHLSKGHRGKKWRMPANCPPPPPPLFPVGGCRTGGASTWDRNFGAHCINQLFVCSCQLALSSTSSGESWKGHTTLSQSSHAPLKFRLFFFN